jgi:hypothetical protein
MKPPLGADLPGTRLTGLQCAFQGTAGVPTEVTRAKRLGQLALLTLFAFMPVMFMVIGSLMISPMLAMFLFMFEAQETKTLAELKALGPTHIVAASAHQDPLVRYAASAQWPENQAIHDRLAAHVDQLRSRLEEQKRRTSGLQALYLASLEQQAKLQQRIIAARSAGRDPRDEAKSLVAEFQSVLGRLNPFFLGMCLVMVLFFPVIWLFWNMLIRGGLNMYALGLTLVRSNGRRAGPLRCAWRTFLVWGPVAAAFALATWFDYSYWSTWQFVHSDDWMLPLAGALSWVGLLLLPAYALHAMLFPRRGLHDWLAGTYVVPR